MKNLKLKKNSIYGIYGIYAFIKNDIKYIINYTQEKINEMRVKDEKEIK